jgi:hypothetical protein
MNVPYNAAIPGGQVRKFCRFSAAELEEFKEIIDKNTLSTRSMDRLAIPGSLHMGNVGLLDSSPVNATCNLRRLLDGRHRQASERTQLHSEAITAVGRMQHVGDGPP